MSVEGQDFFKDTPLGRAATPDAAPEQPRYTIETDDGFTITLDSKSDTCGTVAETQTASGHTRFLIINSELFNAEVLREGVQDESVSKTSDNALLSLHGNKLLSLIQSGEINT